MRRGKRPGKRGKGSKVGIWKTRGLTEMIGCIRGEGILSLLFRFLLCISC